MSNAVIRAELEARLKAWADSQTPEVKVAWENIHFTKPAEGSLWLEPILVPNDTMNKELSTKRKTYLGIFQINCWAPSGKGMGQVEKLAQSLIDLFPVLPKTGLVSIEKTPTAEKPLLDNSGWVIVPVTIQYRMETT